MIERQVPKFWLFLRLTVVPLVNWLALKYRRARRRRSACRLEPMAWLGAIDPNHAALPTTTRHAPTMPAPSRWPLGRVAIYAAQAEIGWLTWVKLSPAALSPTLRGASRSLHHGLYHLRHRRVDEPMGLGAPSVSGAPVPRQPRRPGAGPSCSPALLGRRSSSPSGRCRSSRSEASDSSS